MVPSPENTPCDETSWDVWYTFTPQGIGDFRITATLLSGAQTPAISVFDACPPVANSELACARVPMSGSVNTLEFAGTPGTQYLIRVATNFSQRSDFSVVADLIGVPPVCPADWNDDGDVNSQDFFNQSADFNGDGTTSSQDFFDFLTSFFAGC